MSNRKRKGKKPRVAVRGNKGQQLLIITNKKDNPNKTKKKKNLPNYLYKD